MKRAVLLVDHGSRRAEANALLERAAAQIAVRYPDVVARFAHMELAPPTIADVVAECVEAGVDALAVVPWFLGPGNHSREDIPRMVREACATHPALHVEVTEPLGPDARLVEIALDRMAEVAAPRGRQVDVYYDYISPYAYFLSLRIDAVVAPTGARLRWKPIDLAQLESFAGAGPYTAGKRAYIFHDVGRSAAQHGIPIATPKPFPVRSALANRAALVAQEAGFFPDFHARVFRAAWAEQRDIGEEHELAACVRDAGGDPEATLEGAHEPERAEAVAAFTREAEAAGVFGVPTLRLDDELFWGNDRLDALAWRLRSG